MMGFLAKFLAVGFTLIAFTEGQSSTLSGCHFHGSVQYCYLPNGSETPVTTRTSASSTGPTSSGTVASVSASTTAAITSSTSSIAVPASVTGCHNHGTQQFCIASGTEYLVLNTPTTSPLPTAYSQCHLHDETLTCIAPDGTEVGLAGESGDEESPTSSGTAAAASSTSSGRNCHFHAGVEHCLDEGETEVEETQDCSIVVREYDVGLRVGLIFVILFTSALAVFAPMFLTRFTNLSLKSIIFTILKQFGTGVIISTAFVHLLTHAELMFGNSCLGTLEYESTATSIAMAGVFLSFVIEFIGHRLIQKRSSITSPALDAEHGADQGASKDLSSSDNPQLMSATKETSTSPGSVDNHFSVTVMEAGIVFHSILIGITLVVSGDSFFRTLFVVILFHQMFEGLALGTRIASLPATTSQITKITMGTIFALITPIGMAIGTGVLHQFNGNDPSTIVAIGTLDSLSAGILLWVGLVEMLYHDWFHGSLKAASLGRTVTALLSLVVGMAVMSLLGKWA